MKYRFNKIEDISKLTDLIEVHFKDEETHIYDYEIHITYNEVKSGVFITTNKVIQKFVETYIVSKDAYLV